MKSEIRLAVAAATLAAATGSIHPSMGSEYVAGIDNKFPKLRYTDSQTSVNDRCPLTKAKLNPNIDPLFVNGRPVGFC